MAAINTVSSPTIVVTPPATGVYSHPGRTQPPRRLSVPVGPLSSPIRSGPARRHSTVLAPSLTSSFNVAVDSPRSPTSSLSASTSGIGSPRVSHQRRVSLATLPESSQTDGHGGSPRRESFDNGRQVRSRKHSNVDASSPPIAIRADEVIDALVRYVDDRLINATREPLPQPSEEFSSALIGLERQTGGQQEQSKSNKGSCAMDNDENKASKTRRKSNNVEFLLPTSK